MKKILFLLFFVVSLTGQAQVFLGGEVSFWRNISDSYTQFSLSPEFGGKFAKNKKWEWGLGLSYSLNSNDDFKVHILGLSPYFRFTAVKIGRVGFFVEARTEMYAGKVKLSQYASTIPWPTYKQVSWPGWETGGSFGLSPGLKIQISKRLDFMTHIGFLGYQQLEDIGGKDGAGFSLSGNNLSLGMLYNF